MRILIYSISEDRESFVVLDNEIVQDIKDDVCFSREQSKEEYEEQLIDLTCELSQEDIDFIRGKYPDESEEILSLNKEAVKRGNEYREYSLSHFSNMFHYDKEVEDKMDELSERLIEVARKLEKWEYGIIVKGIRTFTVLCLEDFVKKYNIDKVIRI